MTDYRYTPVDAELDDQARFAGSLPAGTDVAYHVAPPLGDVVAAHNNDIATLGQCVATLQRQVAHLERLVHRLIFEQNTELRRFKESVPWEAISTALIFSTPLYEADRKMLDIVQDWMASNRPEEVEP